MKGKKATILLGIIAIVVGAIIASAVLNTIAPCTHMGLAFIGFLLLFVAIAFGITGNLAFGGISGTAFAVFLLLSALRCF